MREMQAHRHIVQPKPVTLAENSRVEVLMAELHAQAGIAESLVHSNRGRLRASAALRTSAAHAA